jgi:hypothetical protein
LFIWVVDKDVLIDLSSFFCGFARTVAFRDLEDFFRDNSFLPSDDDFKVEKWFCLLIEFLKWNEFRLTPAI